MEDNVNLPLDADEGLSFEPRSSTSGGGSKRNRARRSSILKIPRGGPLQDLGNTEIVMTSRRRSLKRVSFSAAKQVKEFKKFDTESQTFTVWNQSYEEEQSRGDGGNTSTETVNDQETGKVQLGRASAEAMAPLNVEIPVISISVDSPPNSFVPIVNGGSDFVQMLTRKETLRSTGDGDLPTSSVDMDLTRADGFCFNEGSNSPVDMELTGTVPYSPRGGHSQSFSAHKSRSEFLSTADMELTGMAPINATALSVSAAKEPATLLVSGHSCYENNLSINMELTEAVPRIPEEQVNNTMFNNTSFNMELTGTVPYSPGSSKSFSVHKSRSQFLSTVDMELTEMAPINSTALSFLTKGKSLEDENSAAMEPATLPVSGHSCYENNLSVNMELTEAVPRIPEEQAKNTMFNTTSFNMELTGTVPKSPAGGHSHSFSVHKSKSEFLSTADMELTEMAQINSMALSVLTKNKRLEEETGTAMEPATLPVSDHFHYESDQSVNMELTEAVPKVPEEQANNTMFNNISFNMELTAAILQTSSFQKSDEEKSEIRRQESALSSPTSERNDLMAVEAGTTAQFASSESSILKDVSLALHETAPCEYYTDVRPSGSDSVADSSSSAPHVSTADDQRDSTVNEEAQRGALPESTSSDSHLPAPSPPKTITKEWQRAVLEAWRDEVTSAGEDASMHHGRWELEELSDWKCNVTFLHNSLLLNISLGLPLPEERTESGVIVKHRSISSISFQNPSPLQLQPRGDQFLKLAHRILLREWPSQRLESLCKNTKQLAGLLVQLSSSVRDAAEFVLALVDIAGSHCICQVSDLKVTVGFVSTRLEMAFTVTVAYSYGLSKTREMGVQVNAVKGVDANKIQELVSSCGDGWTFVKSLVSHVDSYIKTREAVML